MRQRGERGVQQAAHAERGAAPPRVMLCHCGLNLTVLHREPRLRLLGNLLFLHIQLGFCHSVCACHSCGLTSYLVSRRHENREKQKQAGRARARVSRSCRRGPKNVNETVKSNARAGRKRKRKGRPHAPRNRTGSPRIMSLLYSCTRAKSA
jgi:hypothetical protein